MLSVFCSPSRYTQGKGATAALGREMAALGLEGPALLIAGKTVIGRLADTWKSSLDEAGMRHTVHRFGGECSLAEIERVKAAARQCGARTIVGAGGGKVLDTARAAAADLGLPVVNCPTVASSDAPCSALSVIYTEEGVFQEYRFYRKNPDLVLVDTQVIAKRRRGCWSPAWETPWPPGSRPERASPARCETCAAAARLQLRWRWPSSATGPSWPTGPRRSRPFRPRSSPPRSSGWSRQIPCFQASASSHRGWRRPTPCTTA